MKKTKTIFSTDGCSNKNFKYVRSDQSEFEDVFMAFNLWVHARCIFESCS